MSSKYSKYDDDDSLFGTKTLLTTAGTIAGAGFCYAMYLRYKVAAPHQYILKTGLGITGSSTSKTTFLFPFQKHMFISMNPMNHRCNVKSMTSQSIDFNLPIVINYRPFDPIKNPREFQNYADRLSNLTHEEIDLNVVNAIDGETRSLVTKMTADELRSDRDKFRTEVTVKVQEKLAEYGLEVTLVNIEELSDTAENKFFEQKKQKALEEASTEAVIAVAEAKKLADIGAKQRMATTRQSVAMIESETVTVENENKRKMEESKKDYDVAIATYSKQKEIANIEAQMAAKQREMEMLKDVEEKRLQQQTAAHRATEMSKATIVAEAAIKESEGKAASIKLLADANLYAAQQEAIAIKAKLQAEADGLNQLFQTSDPNHTMAYLFMKNNVYEKLADSNAKAVNGMNPKVTIFQNGNSENGGDAFSPIKNILNCLPPVLSMLQEQTNIKLPTGLTGTIVPEITKKH